MRIVEAIIGRRAHDARDAVVRHIRDVERDITDQLGQAGDRHL
jgi:DNA-binding GntR family transcriptional regulator